MEKEKVQIEIVFVTEVLGSQPQKDVVTEYIHPDVPDDEAEALPEKMEKATTAFHKVDAKPVFFDYQIKGFLKEAAKVVNGLKVYKDLKALRSKVEDHIFITPRIVPLEMPDGTQLTFCERPLRAETAQGPRIALARSEEAPAGTRLHFTVEIMAGSPITRDILGDLLSYGADKGLGQWRNGGHGRFEYKVLA